MIKLTILAFFSQCDFLVRSPLKVLSGLVDDITIKTREIKMHFRNYHQKSLNSHQEFSIVRCT